MDKGKASEGAERQANVSDARGIYIGDGGKQINYFYGALPSDVGLTSPRLVGMIPSLADCRQTRQAEREIELASQAKGAAVSCMVLSGMGGVGKTQIAAAFAHRMRDRGDVALLIWASAVSRDSIINAYAEAARKALGIEGGNPAESAARLLAWLAEANSPRWLIVLDNLNDPADINGLWPPDIAMRGLTIVTTRRRDSALSGQGRKLFEVGVFTPAESASYLHNRFAGQEQLSVEADHLAEDLGHLPLALAQSTAYMLDLALDCANYRVRLNSRRHRLADILPDPASLPDEHTATVAVTWSISIERADRLRPVGLARPMLELIAGSYDQDEYRYITNGNFWSPILTSSYARGYLSARLGKTIEQEEARDAFFCLRKFSLISIDPAGGYHYIWSHPVLRRVVRDSLSESEREEVQHTIREATFNYFLISQM